jgi:hypothetical protein
MTRTSVTPTPTAQVATPQTPMTPTELVIAIGVTLTQLDQTLMEPDLVNQPARWQQIYAMRKHLDDQQRSLVAATIQADDPAFQALTGKIQLAIKQLQKVIDDLKKIDGIINAIAEVSAGLDEILKAVA